MQIIIICLLNNILPMNDIPNKKIIIFSIFCPLHESKMLEFVSVQLSCRHTCTEVRVSFNYISPEEQTNKKPFYLSTQQFYEKVERERNILHAWGIKFCVNLSESRGVPRHSVKRCSGGCVGERFSG